MESVGAPASTVSSSDSTDSASLIGGVEYALAQFAAEATQQQVRIETRPLANFALESGPSAFPMAPTPHHTVRARASSSRERYVLRQCLRVASAPGVQLKKSRSRGSKARWRASNSPSAPEGTHHLRHRHVVAGTFLFFILCLATARRRTDSWWRDRRAA